LQSTRADLVDLGGNLPSPANGVITHDLYLEGERLLVMGGDASVERDAWPAGSPFRPGQKPYSEVSFEVLDWSGLLIVSPGWPEPTGRVLSAMVPKNRTQSEMIDANRS
jgi:hypothetical protein